MNPSLHLLMSKTLIGSVGNLTNASRLILCLEVNWIPCDRISFKYLMAYFAADTCEGEALCK